MEQETERGSGNFIDGVGDRQQPRLHQSHLKHHPPNHTTATSHGQSTTQTRLPPNCHHPLVLSAHGTASLTFTKLFSSRPDSFDWREYGVISEVLDQEGYGTCFAHPVVATIEALYLITRGERLRLARQELVDVISTGDDEEGGNVIASLEWIKACGISLEADYGPYVGIKGPPKDVDVDTQRLVHINGHICIPPRQEALVLDTIMRQPVIASMDVGSSFDTYKGGIYYGDEGDATGGKTSPHTVEIVGFGSEGEGKDFLIVKNSYGRGWGMDGYMHVGRNTKSGVGVCGIYRSVVYPLLDKIDGVHTQSLPLFSRIRALENVIGDSSDEEKSCDDVKKCIFQLHNMPGVVKTFLLATKFCYGVKIGLAAMNLASLKCAAEYVQVNEDYGEEELHIVSRCINSLVLKAWADPALFNWPVSGCSATHSPVGNVLCYGIHTASNPHPVIKDWWYEDVSFLRSPLHKRLILAIGLRGMKPERIARSLVFYAHIYPTLMGRQSSFRNGNCAALGLGLSVPSDADQRTLLQDIQFPPAVAELIGRLYVIGGSDGRNYLKSLIANLSAANCFKSELLKMPENGALVQKAKYFYISGFFLTASPNSIQLVAERADANKVYGLYFWE